MATAQGRAWRRDVDRLRFGDVGQPRVFELMSFGGQRRLDDALGLVGSLAGSRALVRGQLADVRQQAADAPVLPAKVVDLERRQPALLDCACDGRQRLLRELVRIAHAVSLRRISKRISAAAAATFKDSTPWLSCMVTSFRSDRETPCASLPTTIMPAFSIRASATGSPPDAAA